MSMLSERSYALRRALAMIVEAPLVFLLAVALSAAALALPMSLASVAAALAPAAGRLQPSPELSLFIAPTAGSREVDGIRARLTMLPDVVDVRLIPRDVALVELGRRVGSALAADELVNPLPDVLVVRLAARVAADRVDMLATDLRRWPQVDSVRADTDWYRKLGAIARVGLTAAVALGTVVGILVVLIIIGTVRLHATTRADEIEVLRLAGATRGFIVRPYAYSAAITLTLAATVAGIIVFGLHAALAPPIAALAQLYGQPEMTLDYPRAEPLLAAIGAAGVLGWAIGHLGARAAFRA
jgi:cell division transport system permease protein